VANGKFCCRNTGGVGIYLNYISSIVQDTDIKYLELEGGIAG